LGKKEVGRNAVCVLYLFVVGRDAEDKARDCESSQNSSHLCSEEEGEAGTKKKD
jgi:hypothetical protein